MRAFLMVLLLVCLPVASFATDAVKANEIVLGQSASFSGSFAEQAASYRDGALLCFDEVNRKGGVHGRKIRLISMDDQYKADLAVRNTLRLINDHDVFALFNYTWTPIARAVMPIASRNKIPFFAPYTGAQDVYQSGNPYVFTVRASFAAELEMIVRHLQLVGMRDIAVVRYSSKTGDELLAELDPLLKKYDSRLAGVGIMQNNSAQPDAAVAALKKVNASAIILGVSGSDAVAFIKKFNAGGGKRLPYFARSLAGAKQIAMELGDEATGISVTQLVPNPFKDVLAVTREYKSLLRQINPEAKPDYIALEGFISAKVMVEALRRTGPELTRDRFIKTLSNAGKIDIGGFEVNFRPGNRNGSEFVDITMIGRNGRILD